MVSPRSWMGKVPWCLDLTAHQEVGAVGQDATLECLDLAEPSMLLSWVMSPLPPSLADS